MNGRLRLVVTLCFGGALAVGVAGQLRALDAERPSSPTPLPRGERVNESRGRTGRADDAPVKRQPPKYQSAVLRGKVVELGPHVLDAFRMPMDDDAGKGIVALVTDSGEVHPLVKDVRSRGFWMDKRLRGRPMELHVHKFPGLPFVRLIDAYSFKDGTRLRVDYWCTICAITTYEPGPCPCCQDEIELREVMAREGDR